MANVASPATARPFSAADLGALAHLYRGELYRSTVWRSRLDMTTNWSVATTGIALTVTFSSSTASPLPLLLVGLLVAVFLSTEARRYRFFDRQVFDRGLYQGEPEEAIALAREIYEHEGALVVTGRRP